jgi:hypothetical protein
MIMDHESAFGKMLSNHVAKLLKFLTDCQQQGKRLDEVERGLMQHFTEIGRASLEEYVQQAGDGDVGETLPQADRCLQRSPEPHTKTYRSIFGPVIIRRYVYWSRPGQKIEAVPLDAQLGLPAGESSYVLQDFAGRLATEMSYAEAVKWLAENLGIATTLRAAETMVAKLAEHSESFSAAQASVTDPPEAKILGVTADGKGVPMRRPLEQRLQEELGIRPHQRHHKTEYAPAQNVAVAELPAVASKWPTWGRCTALLPGDANRRICSTSCITRRRNRSVPALRTSVFGRR